MDIFAISFRLKDDGAHASTYPSRYRGLIDEIKRLNKFGDWQSTTSFHVIASDLTASQLASKLFLLSHVAGDDQIIVINLSNKADAPGLRGSVPDAEKLLHLLTFR